MADVIVRNKKEFDEVVVKEYESIVIHFNDAECIEINPKPGKFNLNSILIKRGKIILRGDLMVEAEGESQIIALDKTFVTARNYSRVIAKDKSRVSSWENSIVMSYGSSSVVAYANSCVIAHELSTVDARGNSKIIARGSSRIITNGDCHVTAFEAAIVKRMSEDAKVEINDLASLI